MDLSRWHTRAICTCGFHTEAPFGQVIHAMCGRGCCPKCGAPRKGKGIYDPEFETFVIRTMRKVWIGTWWKPWTWDDSHWETKERDNG